MRSYGVWIAVAVVVVILAIAVPTLLITSGGSDNPHSDEELARLTAQMEIDYSNQKAAFEDLLAADPNDYLALAGLGFFAGEEGDYAKMANYLNQAIAVKSDDAGLYVMLAEAYYRMKLTDKAIAAIDQAVALAPDDQGILLSAGYIYAQSPGMEDRARDFWQRAYDLDPNSEQGKNAYHMLNPDIPMEEEVDNPHTQ